MAHSTILLGLLVAVSYASATGFWPQGQELTYRYSANVQVGSVEPAEYASEYTIHGKLKVQAKEDEAYFKLDDVRYQLYNGDSSLRDQSSQLPVPEEASPLSSAFRVQYKDGKVKKLFTETSDPLWALNMKKGLASLLQLDLTRRMRMDVPSAFWGEEDTVFGNCDVSYSFIGYGDYNTITKTVNPESCRNYPYKMFANEERHGCGLENKERPNSSLYKRMYRIQLGDTPVLTDITSEYGYSIATYRGNGDAYFVWVNQTATLVKNTPTERQLSLSEEQEVQDLTYTLPESDSPLSAGLDFSLGRINIDSENLVSKAVSLLDEILNYQDEVHVDTKTPNLKKSGLTTYYINQVLGRLNVEGLSNVYSQLSQGSSDREAAKREVFVKLLPEVGTHAAAITVRNLIRKHKIKTFAARNQLQVLPFNVYNPNEKLVQELEDLIELNEEYPEEVRHAAILSFATLVYKASKNNPTPDVANKYAQIFFNRISENKNDFATQLVYLQGLGNIQVGKAAEYLEALILEGDQFPRHLRHLALWNFAPNVYNNYNKAYRVYWPILVNTKLHLQQRAAALKILLEAAANADHYFTIHAYMSTQRNDIHLYKIYYKTLIAKSTTTNPCYGKTAEFARQILQYADEPLYDNWGSGVEVYDFTNEKYGFGRMIRLQSVADQATGFPSVLYGEYQELAHGLVDTPYSMYLKMEGIEQLLWGQSGDYQSEPVKHPKIDLLGLAHKTNQLNTDDLIRKVTAAQGKLQKPIHIEVILTKQGRTIQTFFLDNNRLNNMLEKDIPHKIKEFRNVLQNLNTYVVRMESSSFKYVPTDLGVPLIIYKGTPSIFSVNGGVNSDNKLQLDTTFKLRSTTVGRIILLNPVAGVWHGAEIYVNKDIQIPVRVGLQRDERGFKFVLGSPNGANDLTSILGGRWFKQVQTFIYEEDGNKNLLGASCPSCRRVASVTRGYKNQNEYEILHTKLPGTGMIADVRTFECERDVTLGSVKHAITDFFSNNQQNSHDQLFARIFLGLSHLITYVDLNPRSGQCGFAARLIRDPEVGQGSQVEVSLKVTGGEIPGGNIVLQGVKLNIVGEWVLRGNNGDAIEKSDIKTVISTSAGNEDNSVNLQVSSYKRNKPSAKWCWNLSKKYPARGPDALAFGWGNEEVNSKAVISVGSFVEDVDGSCPTDGASVTINMKGEISDEQKQRAQGDDWPYGQCKEDKQKSEWQDYSFVPNTQACYQGSIILSTARKVTYSVTHSKLPSYIEDVLRWIEEMYRTEYAQHFTLVPGGQLADVGTAEFVAQYSAYKPTVTYSVRTPQRHYQYLDVPTGLKSSDDYNAVLDNTHYSRFHLLIESTGISKPCIISSENVYTADNATVAHKQSGEYVLVAGDSADPNRFSSFVKSEGGTKLALKFVNDGVSLEVSESGASINGKSISLESGVQYPADDPNYAIRVWKLGDLVMGYSRRTAVYFYYTGHAVDVEQPLTNRGRVSGLCGNLNGDPTDDY